MKYIDEYRDGEVAQKIAARIAAEADPSRSYSFMEFCGGHTHAISRYGIAGLLPAGLRMIHGPGCPVCVLPIGRIDLALSLAGDDEHKRVFMLQRLDSARAQKVKRKELAAWLERAAAEYRAG